MVLFLDTSWSILEDVNNSWKYAKNFTADVVELAYHIVRNISLLETGNIDEYTLKVSLITFSSGADLIYNLDEFGDSGISSQDELRDVQQMIYDVQLPEIKFRDQMQGTHARDAIQTYLDDVQPITTPTESGICLIMITDGRPDDPFLQNPCYVPSVMCIQISISSYSNIIINYSYLLL